MSSPHPTAHLSPDSTPYNCQVHSELVLDRVGMGFCFVGPLLRPKDLSDHSVMYL